MLTTEVQKVSAAWQSLANFVYVPHTEEEYQETVKLLDSLIDEVGEDETHPLASLMDVLGLLIENYENQYLPEIT